MTSQQNNNSELLQDLDSYRKQNNYLSIENQALKGLLLSFMLESRFDPDEIGGGYFKVKEIMEEVVMEQASIVENRYEDYKEVSELSASKMIIDVGQQLLRLLEKYPHIAKMDINKEGITVYIFNKDMKEEVCFTIISVEESEHYDSNLFLDSDWVSSSSNIKQYESILHDIATAIYNVDSSYTENNISIEDFIDYSDTGQNPLWNKEEM